ILEPEFYVRNRTGELMSRATNDLNAVRMVLGPGIMYTATTIVTMILAILVMVTLSPSLTLWVLLPAPVVAVAVWFFGKTIHDLYESIRRRSPRSPLASRKILPVCASFALMPRKKRRSAASTGPTASMFRETSALFESGACSCRRFRRLLGQAFSSFF